MSKEKENEKKEKGIFDTVGGYLSNVFSPGVEIDIKKDTIIRNKFHKGFNREDGKPVRIFVIHGTAGGGTLRYVRSGVRAKEYRRGIALFHYLIQQDGRIWEVIDPKNWVYHSSVGRMDKQTIGVELVNLDYRNRKPYTSQQYRALINLYEFLRQDFTDMDAIASHNRMKQKYARGTKECPGKGFDWYYFRDLMENDWEFQYQDPYESIWSVSTK